MFRDVPECSMFLILSTAVSCVCLFHCVIATEFELHPVQSTDAVDSLNVKHELRSKREKQFRQLFHMM